MDTFNKGQFVPLVVAGTAVQLATKIFPEDNKTNVFQINVTAPNGLFTETLTMTGSGKAVTGRQQKRHIVDARGHTVEDDPPKPHKRNAR